MTLYQLAVLGDPSNEQVDEVEKFVAQSVEAFGLKLGKEVGWSIKPKNFRPLGQQASAAIFFGGATSIHQDLQFLLQQGIPVLPVCSEPSQIHKEIPEVLWPLNCISYNYAGVQRIATALLECVGLLPRQRGVFLSYRRDESREAALQLFDELSARQFNVFLDTHGIAPAEDFQEMLWHRLRDSDVLVMLDTPGYFNSRWTSAEFGRALATGVSVLCIDWPNAIPSPRTLTANRINLLINELDVSGRLSSDAIQSICLRLEAVRSQGHAVRNLNLLNNLQNAIETIGGSFVGVGPNRSALIRLPNGKEVIVYPTVGVPTAVTLHEAIINSHNSPERFVAVLYDEIGLHHGWQDHIDWLESEIKTARLIKAHKAGWLFADWEAA